MHETHARSAVSQRDPKNPLGQVPLATAGQASPCRQIGPKAPDDDEDAASADEEDVNALLDDAPLRPLELNAVSAADELDTTEEGSAPVDEAGSAVDEASADDDDDSSALDEYNAVSWIVLADVHASAVDELRWAVLPPLDDESCASPRSSAQLRRTTSSASSDQASLACFFLLLV